MYKNIKISKTNNMYNDNFKLENRNTTLSIVKMFVVVITEVILCGSHNNIESRIPNSQQESNKSMFNNYSICIYCI